MTLGKNPLGKHPLGKSSSASGHVGRSVEMPWAVLGPIIGRAVEMPWSVRVGRSVNMPWSVRVGRIVSMPWTVIGPIIGRAVEMPWSVRVGRSVEIPWSVRVGRVVNMVWSAAGVGRAVNISWTVHSHIGRAVEMLWAATVHVGRAVEMRWSVLNTNPVGRAVTMPWAVRTNLPPLTYESDVEFKKGATLLNIDGCSISGDENSWGYTLNASFSDVTTWGELRDATGKGIVITLTVRSQIYNFIVDGVEKSQSFGKTSYTLKARSNTVKLTTPYSNKLTKEWPATTAKTVAQELCDAAGVLLDWQAIDWPLSNRLLSVKDKYPLQIIQQLASAPKFVVQSSKDGSTLIVRPRSPISPTKFSGSVPDHTLTDLDDIYTNKERYEHREGFDSIEISNQRTDSKPQYSIAQKNNGRTLEVSVVPFQDIVLNDSADGNLSIYYEGVFTEERTEEIEIIEGKGRVSAPWYGTVSSNYIYDDLGALTITENREITTAVNAQSVVEITYTTKFHRYQLTPANGVDKAQVYINEN